MVIDGYFIGDYLLFFYWGYWWLLMIILLMDIGNYSIGTY
jgi:hypothetical protein